MAELVVSQKDKELLRYSFEQGIIGIGRGAANEIHLNSPAVSDQHARISLFEGACHIQNLAPRGNTFVNEREVERTRLHDKDVLNIGHYKIVLLDRALSRPESEAGQGSAGHDFDAAESTDPVLQHAAEAIPGGGGNNVAADANVDAEVPAAGTRGHSTSLPEDDASDQSAVEAGEPEAPSLTDTPIVNDLSMDQGDAPDQRDGGIDTTEQSARREKATTVSVFEKRRQSEHGLLATGVEILAGPAKGNRIYFTQQNATLGIGGQAVVAVKSVADGYVALASNPGIDVTINGESVKHFPASIIDGDRIDFGNISVRFFVEN